MIAVNVRLAVGCHSDGAYTFDPGWIGRHELPPKGSSSRRQVQPIDLGGQLVRSVDVEGVAVRRPFYGFLSRGEAWNRARVAPSYRIEISLLVGTNCCHKIPIGRNHKRGRPNPLGREGLRFSSCDVLHVESHAVVWLVSREEYPVSFRKPACSDVVDSVLRQRLGLAALVGNKVNWAGEPSGWEMTHFWSRDNATAAPSPSRTAGDPSVLRR